MSIRSATKIKNTNPKHPLLNAYLHCTNLFNIKRAISDPQRRKHSRTSNKLDETSISVNIDQNKGEEFDIKHETNKNNNTRKSNENVQTTQNEVKKSSCLPPSIPKNSQKPIKVIPKIEKSEKKSVGITILKQNMPITLQDKTSKNQTQNDPNKTIKITRRNKSRENKIKIIINHSPKPPVNMIISKKNQNNEQKEQPLINEENKNEINKKVFNFIIPVVKKPVCVAISGIKGDINKLQYICEFIKMNPQLNFVFMGNVFDDMSDKSKIEVNMSCLSLIVNEFLQDDVINKSDIDTNGNDKVTNLLSEFKSIKFNDMKYEHIHNRVKFIAGKAEYDFLSVILKGYHKVNDKYVFIDPKWKSAFTFEQMSLIYHYLANCNRSITLNIGQSSINHNRVFQGAVYFKNYDDTQVKIDFKALIVNDNPMTLVSFDKETGFTIKGMSLPFKFAKSSFRYPLNKI